MDEDTLARAQRGLMQSASLHIAAEIQRGDKPPTKTRYEHDARVEAAYAALVEGLHAHLTKAKKRAERQARIAARKEQNGA